MLITSGLERGSTCRLGLSSALGSQDVSEHGRLDVLHRLQFVFEKLVFLGLFVVKHYGLLVLCRVSIQ